MYFKDLRITNFRAIKNIEINELPLMVVIAGPNGCGKTTIFDAIRLLKSVYGGYQPNEWQQWFSEFQINLDIRYPDLITLCQDKTKPFEISANIVLSDQEIKYISENIDELLRPMIWDEFSPDAKTNMVRETRGIASQIEQYGQKVEDEIVNRSKLVQEELSNKILTGKLEILGDKKKRIKVQPSRVLQLIFSQYDPKNIGIIEYSGSNRTYNREQLGGINLNIQTEEQRGSQQALYNYAAKFSNIKSELASRYIRDLLLDKAGIHSDENQSLLDSLQELSNTFFPGKEIKGPQPTKDGRLRFLVTTDAGFEHDIDDLSSGEKEVLYGYLKQYNLSPHNSVLLIDEPELHLNPRLVQGLPQFYQKHLGKLLNNQIWLNTHSDAMLRESLTLEETVVFHMTLPNAINFSENQIQILKVKEEIDHTIIDLVGDLATYRPNSINVIFEGEEETKFDIFMVSTLFPDFANKVNMIAGGEKEKVRRLHELLLKAEKTGVVSGKIFSIIDRDLGPEETTSPNTITWDVYHIENYLLVDTYILSALRDLLGEKGQSISLDYIQSNLLDSARETMSTLVRQILEQEVNKKMVTCIDSKIDPTSTNISQSLIDAIGNSKRRIENIINNELNLSKILSRENKITKDLENDLINGNWVATFRGRDILKLFIKKTGQGIKYQTFRNSIITKMRDASYQSPNMKKKLNTIFELSK